MTAAAPIHLPAGIYRYAQWQYGRISGHTTIFVTRRVGNITIEERTDDSIGGRSMSGVARLVLSGALEPVRYADSYAFAGRSGRATVSIAHGNADVSSSATGGHMRRLSLLPPTRHFAIIEPGMAAGLFALPAQMRRWGMALATTIAPSLAQDEPLESSALPVAARPADVPRTDRSLTIAGNVPFTMWYDPLTFVIDKIVTPSRHAVMTRIRELAEHLTRHREGSCMIQAMITCPSTGKVVPSGIVFGTLAAFDATRLENNAVACAACGQSHLIDNSTVRIFPSEPKAES